MGNHRPCLYSRVKRGRAGKHKKKNHGKGVWDERKVSPGEKFADADLLGAPLQMVISPRNLEKGEVEVKNRATGEKTFVKVEEALAYAENFIKTEKEKLMTSAASMKAFQ